MKKKDLQEKYQLSHNTVTETLKACGLDTSKRDYSEEEINTRFIPARQMLDGGKTYDDVKARFSSLGQSSPGNASAAADPNETPIVDTGEFAQQVATEVEAGTREVVRQVAQRVIGRLPAMTLDVLNELARNNNVKAVYQKHRNQLLSELPPSSPSSTPALPPDEASEKT